MHFSQLFLGFAVKMPEIAVICLISANLVLKLQKKCLFSVFRVDYVFHDFYSGVCSKKTLSLGQPVFSSGYKVKIG